MGGFCGVVSKDDCVTDLFFGTDYHSHLGTRRGGLATWDAGRFTRFIHRHRERAVPDQVRDRRRPPLRHDGHRRDQRQRGSAARRPFAPGHVRDRHRGARRERPGARPRRLGSRSPHFAEMGGGEVNPTEVVASLIDQGRDFAEGIAHRPGRHRGLVLHAAAHGAGHLRRPRPRSDGRPIVIGRKDGACAATFETCAFPNLEYEVERCLGPGRDRADRRPTASTTVKPPGERDADLLVPLGLLRLPRLRLRGHQRRGDPQPLRRRAGAPGRRRGRHGRRHPRLRHRRTPSATRPRPASRTAARS